MPSAEAVLDFLERGGVVYTRVRERSVGIVHDWPSGFLVLPGMSLRPQDVVTILEELEHRGKIVRAEEVVPHDSTEYRVTWRIAGQQAA